jgi:protease-4
MIPALIGLIALGAGSADFTPGGTSNIRGFARGADALVFDPAATAFVDGFELQYEQFSIHDEHSAFGAYTVVPVGPLRIQGGYEWLPLTNRSFERGSIGASAKLSDYLAIGFMYRGYRAFERRFKEGGTWDAGLYSSPFKWISLSLGVDNMGSPYVLDARQNFQYAGGIVLRPFAGVSWLTVGLQSRLDGKTHDFTQTRGVIDVGSKGVHVYSAYDFTNHFVAVGLQLGLGNVEVKEAIDWQTGDKPRPGTNRNEYASNTTVTFRTHPSESISQLETGHTVELALTDHLRRKSGDFFATHEVTPSVGWRLRRLSREPSVATVILKIGELNVGMGFVDELRGEIMNLRAAGKKVIAEVAYVDDRTYMVAAAADVVRLDKSAVVTVDGFALLAYYFSAALEKIGIKFDVVAVGRYKNAPDALTSDHPKPEEDEVRNDLLGQAQQSLERVLREDRHLAPDRVEAILAKGGVHAKEAKELGLVDELAELDVARPDHERAHTADDLLDRPRNRWGKPPVIAVVPVVGTIVRDDGDNPLPGESAAAKRIVHQLEQAAADPEVAGVVLRVDSGGGEVFASELIYRAVLEVKKKKPIVASMADTAASGGYYVVAPCDAVFAEPNTLTGSIGIFLLKVDLAGLYDLTSIKPFTYKTAPLADWRMTTHGFNDEERARVTALLNEEYEEFMAKVAEGRHLPLERVREIAEGHVYSGRRALELGLVDKLGGLADAIDEVERRAGLSGSDIEVTVPFHIFSFTKAITHAASISVSSPLEELQAMKARLLRWDHEPLALMPQAYEVVP